MASNLRKIQLPLPAEQLATIQHMRQTIESQGKEAIRSHLRDFRRRRGFQSEFVRAPKQRLDDALNVEKRREA